jgi:hypothetical protein
MDLDTETLHIYEALPMWLLNKQPDVFIQWGGDIDKCTEIGVEKI